MRSSQTTPRDIVMELVAPGSLAGSVEAARALLLEYGRHILAQPGSARFCFGTLEKEVESLPAAYHAQGGGCIVARVAGEPAGFVAWRALPQQVAPASWEVKRLWVRPAARGLALGRRLTEEIIARAMSSEQDALYLDTVPETMASAYRLYVELGFEPCPAYNDNAMDGIVFMRKLLR